MEEVKIIPKKTQSKLIKISEKAATIAKSLGDGGISSGHSGSSGTFFFKGNNFRIDYSCFSYHNREDIAPVQRDKIYVFFKEKDVFYSRVHRYIGIPESIHVRDYKLNARIDWMNEFESLYKKAKARLN